MIFTMLIILLFLLAIFFGVALIKSGFNIDQSSSLDSTSIFATFFRPNKGKEIILVFVGLVWVVTWSILLVLFVNKYIWI